MRVLRRRDQIPIRVVGDTGVVLGAAMGGTRQGARHCRQGWRRATGRHDRSGEVASRRDTCLRPGGGRRSEVAVAYCRTACRGRAATMARLAQVEFSKQLPHAETVMPSDALENARQRLRPDRIVQRNHLVVFAASLRRDPHVRPPGAGSRTGTTQVPSVAWRSASPSSVSVGIARARRWLGDAAENRQGPSSGQHPHTTTTCSSTGCAHCARTGTDGRHVSSRTAGFPTNVTYNAPPPPMS